MTSQVNKNGMREIQIRLDAVPAEDGITWFVAGRIEGIPDSEFDFSLLASTREEAMEKAARMVKVVPA